MRNIRSDGIILISMMALPIEALDKDQLTQKRATRALNISLLKADTPAKVVQAWFFYISCWQFLRDREAEYTVF